LISYVRFLFIKMHRENFRDELLAELLPPLEKGGGSHLWNAVGYHFMPMTYAEADRLSKTNKEFIFGLFPQGPIYATLLPEQAQNVIGKVGQQTKGVEKMLTRIGFRYAHRVDPFDGGPHFTCATDEVTLVAESRPAKVARSSSPPGEGRAIVATDLKGPPYFRATLINWSGGQGEDVALGEETIGLLGVQEGDPAWVVPLP
jgi:arginine N-succinyltransferase